MKTLSENYQLEQLKELQNICAQLRGIAVCLGRCEQSNEIHDLTDKLYALTIKSN